MYEFYIDASGKHAAEFISCHQSKEEAFNNLEQAKKIARLKQQNGLLILLNKAGTIISAWRID